jgi:uncharacterized damage-inducible protein DinB
MPTTMTMLLLEGFSPTRTPRAWHGGPTPLGAVRGVPARLAAWRPARGRKTIWELTLHIAYWNYAVRRAITGEPRSTFPRSPSNWPAQPSRPTEAAWRADVALLKEEHRRLTAAWRKVRASSLERVPLDGRKWRTGDLLLGVALHDAYHAGQIQLLKRLSRR